MGIVGMVAAFAVALSLTLHGHGSLALLAAITAAAVLSFFALAVATKIITGEEQLVYLRHHLAAVAAIGPVLPLGGWSPLPALDLASVGLGVFLAFGRIGCARVGCCHGRPCRRFGIVYDFASPYVGVPLFAVQLVEAASVALLATIGAALVWTGAPPGTALVVYTLGYALVRFALELVRGDAARPFAAGFSEAQWTALAIATVVALGGVAGRLPGGRGLVAAPIVLALGFATVALCRAVSLARGGLILWPPDVRELAGALALLASVDDRGTVHLAETSLGIRLSAATIDDDGIHVHHYSISSVDGALAAPAAARVAREILRLRHRRCDGRLFEGARGVQHLVVRPAAVHS
jgi:prolipoprotein diacylglyceryl transferase